MESLVGEMAVFLQEIKQRERAGTLDLDATNALQEALQAACATCEEVLHPAPPPAAAATAVEQEQAQAQAPEQAQAQAQAQAPEEEPQPPQKASGAKAKTAEK